MIIHHHLADLYHTLGLPCEEDIDFTILSVPDIHPQIPFTSPVLRADYFSLIFTKEGAGVYFLDDREYAFGNSSVYFTNPGHVKSYQLQESGSACFIAFSEAFLREHVDPEVFGEFPFLLAEVVPPSVLSPSDYGEFESLYGQIEAEFNRESSFKKAILGKLVHVLLFKLKERFWLEYNPIQEGKGDSRIVKAFQQLLEAEFKRVLTSEPRASRLQVQDLAEQMNLHPNYLNSVIKSKTGRTVNDWISRRTLSVAKTLLLEPGHSLKEIAFRLGFSEATHFSRFFKKHTNLTPTAFRSMNHL